MTAVLFAALMAMTLLGAFGSLYLKKATMVSGTLIGLFKTRQLYLGGFLYAVSILLNIYLLYHLDYSVVLPLTSIAYIWTQIIAHIHLKERITPRQIGGILCIVAGAVLIAAPLS